MEGSASNSSLCSRGCGFFGSPANHNLCSKCYKDYIKEHAADNSVAFIEDHTRDLNYSPANPSSSASSDESSAVVTVSTAATPAAATEDNNIPSDKKKNRCLCCNKKVGILGFGCRCGGTFCGVHRYPETHECELNHKDARREAIAKQNPLVKADKLNYRI